MGREKYGKPWNQLSQVQRNIIRKARAKITQEAMSEAAIHNPDLAKAQIEHSLGKEAEQNPVLAQRIEQVQKASGIKVSDAVFDAEQ